MQRHKYFETVRKRLYYLDTPEVLSPAEDEQVEAGIAAGSDPITVGTAIHQTRRDLPETRGIHIAGRRWFQRSAGNTYHAVTVHLPGGETLSSGRHYGYGEQYLQTAWELLAARGLVQGNYGGTRILRGRYGITYDVADVGRERDL